MARPLVQPKRPLNPYHLFLGAVRGSLRTQVPEGESLIPWTGKKVGELWRALSPEERATWDAKAVEARQVYALKVQEFKANGGTMKRRGGNRRKTEPTETLASGDTIEPAEASGGTRKRDRRRTKPAEALAQPTGASGGTTNWRLRRRIEPAKPLAPGGARRQRLLPKDETKPKKPTAGAYGVFLNENKASIKSSLPAGLGEADVLRAAAAQWKGLPEESLQIYQEKYLKMFKEYQEAMKRYNENKAATSTDSQPAQPSRGKAKRNRKPDKRDRRRKLSGTGSRTRAASSISPQKIQFQQEQQQEQHQRQLQPQKQFQPQQNLPLQHLNPQLLQPPGPQQPQLTQPLLHVNPQLTALGFESQRPQVTDTPLNVKDVPVET